MAGQGNVSNIPDTITLLRRSERAKHGGADVAWRRHGRDAESRGRARSGWRPATFARARGSMQLLGVRLIELVEKEAGHAESHGGCETHCGGDAETTAVGNVGFVVGELLAG